MSTVNLQIDDVLKLKLNSLMEQFESHRIFNNNFTTIKEVVAEKVIAKEVTTPKEVKKEEKKESFFHKFFFSEY